MQGSAQSFLTEVIASSPQPGSRWGVQPVQERRAYEENFVLGFSVTHLLVAQEGFLAFSDSCRCILWASPFPWNVCVRSQSLCAFSAWPFQG